MARMVLRPSARTAILVIIRMLVRHMATGDRVTLQTESSLELARGLDGDSVTDFTVTADSDTAFMVATAFMMATALLAMGLLAEEDPAATEADSPIVADSVAALPAVEVAASQAAAFMAAVAVSMVVEAVSMVAVAADFTAVAADTAADTGN